MAKANPFRLSTKYQDEETDLLYYGYRYYNASTGRWISIDPIEEKGGANLYAFLRNGSSRGPDRLGLEAWDEAFKWKEFPLKPRAGSPERGGETWETATGGDASEPIKFRTGKSKVDCCYKVYVSSDWGAKGWYDPKVSESKTHEEHHYSLIRKSYDMFIERVKTFDRKCMKEPAVDCFRATVGIIADAAFHESRYQNLNYDCGEYGDRCDDAATEKRESQARWKLVEEALQKCEKLKDPAP